jgi:hypothetical protein
MKKPLPFHPFLLAIFPVAFLYGQNVDDVSTSATVGPLVLVLSSTAILLLAVWVPLRDWKKAGLVVSVLLIFVFSYGHVMGTARASSLANDPVAIGAWLLLTVAVMALALRVTRALRELTIVLNVVATVLVVTNLAGIGVQIVDGRRGGEGPKIPDLPFASAAAVRDRRGPDIYYIILDRYASEETLNDLYGFDNSDFLRYLEREGFYVAEGSRGNYPRTQLSLAASLHMQYLDYLKEYEDETGFELINGLLKDYKAVEFLRSIGYRYFHIGWYWEPSADLNVVMDQLSEFSSQLYETTLLWPLDERYGITGDLRHALWEQDRFYLDQLAASTQAPGPKFVYMHLLLPHDPYLFDSQGDYVSEEEASAKPSEVNYVEQLTYLNTRMKQIVGDLLARPESERPVIIIQADEGPYPPRFEEDIDSFTSRATDEELRQKFGILNAYYLPGITESGLYPSISPVNTFRLLFNRYFDADLPLLEDRSFALVDGDHPYHFEEVTHRLAGRD